LSAPDQAGTRYKKRRRRRPRPTDGELVREVVVLDATVGPVTLYQTSRDGGRTWSKRAYESTTGSCVVGYPAVVVLGDGRGTVVIRDSSDIPSDGRPVYIWG
jgi:hypothetical protein